jgi:hypothetical protein
MATNTSISTTLTTIPPELQPYVTKSYTDAEIKANPSLAGKQGILPQAQNLLTKSYADTYGNALRDAGLAGSQRVAGVSPYQNMAGTQLAGMGTPTQFGEGTNAINSGIGTLQGMTDAAATQQFMSPYIQNVLDVNKQEAERDARRNLLSQNLAAARKGSYGASGNILAQSEAQRNFQTQMAKIQASGMQQAYEDARKAQLGQSQGLTQAGTALSNLGLAQQTSELDRIKSLGQYGDFQRGVQQNQLDSQYNDLMAKLNFPVTQLETMNNLIRGVPLAQSGQTQSLTTPPPSSFSQNAGLGLSALGLARYGLAG